MRYLKRFSESFEPDDLMSDEEVKQEVLQRIKDLGETANQWSSRDTLKEFTNWNFWSGDVMVIIDVEIAEKIANELYEYVEDLNPGSPEIDEVYDLL